VVASCRNQSKKHQPIAVATDVANGYHLPISAMRSVGGGRAGRAGTTPTGLITPREARRNWTQRKIGNGGGRIDETRKLVSNGEKMPSLR